MATQINRVANPKEGNFAKVGNFDFGKNRGMFLIPYGKELLTAAELNGDIQSAIQAKLTAAYKDRVFFVHKFQSIEDNSEGEVYETIDQFKYLTETGTIDEVYLLDGTYAEYLQVKELLAAAKNRFHCVYVDEFNVLRHKVSAAGGIVGFGIHQTHALKIRPKAPGVATKYPIRMALESQSEYDSANHTRLGFDPFNRVLGLQGVQLMTLKSVSGFSPAAGTFHIGAYGIDQQINFAELFSATTELRQVGAWVLKNAAGATITLTSIGLVNNGIENVAFSITANTATNYTVGQKAYLTPADITTLAGFGLGYLEAKPLEITLT
jgi:hypothetical protein